MFNKFSEKIKSLFKKKNDDYDDEEYEEYEDDEDDYEDEYHGHENTQNSSEDKTVKVDVKDLLKDKSSQQTEEISKSKLYNMKSEDDEDGEDFDDDFDDEDEDEIALKAAKRKKILMYSCILVGVGLLYLEPFSTEDEPAKVPTVTKKTKRVKKKKNPPEAPKKDKKIKNERVREKVVDVPPENTLDVTNDDVGNEIVDNDNMEKEASPPSEMPPSIDTPNKFEKEKSDFEKLNVKISEAPGNNDKIETLVDSVGSEAIEAKIPAIIPNTRLGEESKKIVVEPPKLEEKIQKKFEYISPPNYERAGRGLVYNCLGKHWACVDQFSYLTCRENLKWQKSQNKSPECFTKNVYATDKDCITVQDHYVEKLEPVDFCNE